MRLSNSSHCGCSKIDHGCGKSIGRGYGQLPLPAKVKVVAEGRANNALCASLKWWWPHLTRCRPLASATFKGLARNPEAFCLASRGFAGYSHRIDFFSKTNLPFASATTYPVDKKKW